MLKQLNTHFGLCVYATHPLTNGAPNAVRIFNGIGIFLQTAIEFFVREFFQGLDVGFFARGPLRQMRNEIAMSSGKVDVASQIIGQRFSHLLQCNLHVRCK